MYISYQEQEQSRFYRFHKSSLLPDLLLQPRFEIIEKLEESHLQKRKLKFSPKLSLSGIFFSLSKFKRSVYRSIEKDVRISYRNSVFVSDSLQNLTHLN